MKEKQKMFQIDNGLRVHERGGGVDKVNTLSEKAPVAVM